MTITEKTKDLWGFFMWKIARGDLHAHLGTVQALAAEYWEIFHPSALSKRGISLEEMPGRMVERTEMGQDDGAYDNEPTLTIHFTDGTYHTITLPAEPEPRSDRYPDDYQC